MSEPDRRRTIGGLVSAGRRRRCAGSGAARCTCGASSLGFRVVVVTMLLGVLVLTAVGTYLYGSIAQGLVDSRQRIAAEDSLRDAKDAQKRFDATDQTDTQAKLTQFATTSSRPTAATRATSRATSC